MKRAPHKTSKKGAPAAKRGSQPPLFLPSLLPDAGSVRAPGDSSWSARVAPALSSRSSMATAALDPAMIFLLGLFASIFQTAYTGVNEQTFLAIKPDGVQRHLVGEIIWRFERKGFKLVAMKLMQASEDLLKQHYIALQEHPFYTRLVKYMSSGPVVAMVWQGLEVVKTARAMIGETNPANSKPGTIRGDFSIEVGRNVIHGSDSVESAQREISLWFHMDELTCWEGSTEHWIYE